MIMTIYTRALKVLMKKPLKLWGLSLLSVALSSLITSLCGVAIPALGIGVAMLMTTSMTMVYLYGYRGEEVKTVQLFSCFKDWNTIKRVLCGMAWMALWIFLWSLIPVVGPIFAIIRAYEYRLTPYILVTEPEIAVTDAIKVSSQRTKGYKGKMFLADFLWIVIFWLACLVLLLFARIPVIGVLFAIVLFVLYIAFVALSPLFMGLVQAAFYEEITNPTIVPNVVVVGSCANCGAPLAAGAKFCASCGKSVEE